MDKIDSRMSGLMGQIEADDKMWLDVGAGLGDQRLKVSLFQPHEESGCGGSRWRGW